MFWIYGNVHGYHAFEGSRLYWRHNAACNQLVSSERGYIHCTAQILLVKLMDVSKILSD